VSAGAVEAGMDKLDTVSPMHTPIYAATSRHVTGIMGMFEQGFGTVSNFFAKERIEKKDFTSCI